MLDQTQTSKLSELSQTNEKLFSELHQFRDKYLEVKSQNSQLKKEIKKIQNDSRSSLNSNF